jgi:hypothetical protein
VIPDSKQRERGEEIKKEKPTKREREREICMLTTISI